MATAAVILAGGSGSRFTESTHKLLADLHGRPVIAHAIDAAVRAAIGPVIVISGAVDLDEFAAADVQIAHNDRWADGQGSSLGCALDRAVQLHLDRVVVGLGDQPFLTADAWQAIAARSGPIVVATYGGTRAQPIALGRSVWSLIDLSGDEGARRLLRERPDLVVEVPCSGNPADIDTLGDLARWNSRTNSP